MSRSARSTSACPLSARRIGRRARAARGAPGAVLIASLLLLAVPGGRRAAPPRRCGGSRCCWRFSTRVCSSKAPRRDLPRALGGRRGACRGWCSASGGVEPPAAVGLLPSLLVADRADAAHARRACLGARADTRRRIGEGGRRRTTRSDSGTASTSRSSVTSSCSIIAQDPRWSTPPWPLLGSLAVLTLASACRRSPCRPARCTPPGVTAAAIVVLAWARLSPGALGAGGARRRSKRCSPTASPGCRSAARTRAGARAAAIGAALRARSSARCTLIAISLSGGSPGIAIMTAAHVVNTSLLLALAWQHHWPYVAPAAVLPAWSRVDGLAARASGTGRVERGDGAGRIAVTPCSSRIRSCCIGARASTAIPYLTAVFGQRALLLRGAGRRSRRAG